MRADDVSSSKLDWPHLRPHRPLSTACRVYLTSSSSSSSSAHSINVRLIVPSFPFPPSRFSQFSTTLISRLHWFSIAGRRTRHRHRRNRGERVRNSKHFLIYLFLYFLNIFLRFFKFFETFISFNLLMSKKKTI